MDLSLGISATPFDYNLGPFYPGSYQSNNNNAGPNGDGNDVYNDPNDQRFNDWVSAGDMWYLPTGAAFFQNQDQTITQTADGVNVGGSDLLNYMAMDQYPSLDGGNGMGGSF